MRRRISPGMIVLGRDQEELPPEWLDSRGGFLWWYLDLLDRQGNGMVLIWSFGLPFLPGYASAASRGQAPRAAAKPSLNCAFYEGGKEVFYALEEFPESACSYREGHWTFGDSKLSSLLVGGTRLVEGELSLTVPGRDRRALIKLSCQGAAFTRTEVSSHGSVGTGESRDGWPLPRTSARAEHAAVSPHNWIPWSVSGTGRASLHMDGTPVMSVQGRAYHDRNGSTVALHQLGIRHWLWGRFPFEDRDRIFYLLWPEDKGQSPTFLAFEVDRGGYATSIDGLDVARDGLRMAAFGMPYWKELKLNHRGRPWLRVRVNELCENGPFYLRSLAHGTTEHGATSPGTVELCRPGRIDKPWQRPLVRMRVHPAHAAPSSWAPLFIGPRQDRIQRLLRHNWRQPGSGTVGRLPWR